MLEIASHVSPQLRDPRALFAVLLYNSRELAPVPKITIDEHGELLSRPSDVGLTGSVLVVLLEPDTSCLERGESDQLWLSVLGADTRHETRSLTRIQQYVRHDFQSYPRTWTSHTWTVSGSADTLECGPAPHPFHDFQRGPLYNYVDLFAGCGGLSLGIERSGGHLQLAVEKSDMASYTFYANFIDETIDDDSWKAYVKSSIENQVASRVAVSPLRDVLDNETAMSKLAATNVDVVVGGPPCQGFSLAGRRNPDDVRNKLPWEYLEFVERTSPKVVVIENVVGMSHKFAADEEAPFVQLQQALRETGRGYEVQAVAVNALHYGAPQNRPRLMIIGLRRDVADENGVSSTNKLWRSDFTDELGETPIPPLAPMPTVAKRESPTIADAIGDLQNVLPESHTKRAAALRKSTRSRADWGLPKTKIKRDQLANQEARNHNEITTQRFRLYQWLRDNSLQPRLLTELAAETDASLASVRMAISRASFPATSPDGTVLARTSEELLALMKSLQTKKHSQKALAWDGPARTVVTLPDDYVHPSEPRIFTVREMARFQGFPDDFEFRGKETTGSLRRRFEVPQYSQVGNAVSPFLALAVGRMIASVLAPKNGDVAA